MPVHGGSRKVEGRGKRSRSKENNKVVVEPTRAFLLSAGRDGRLLIHDPRKGVQPYEKISPSVTAISSQVNALVVDKL